MMKSSGEIHQASKAGSSSRELQSNSNITPENDMISCSDNLEVSVGDWIVVSFSMSEQNQKSWRFIGQILDVKNCRFRTKFLKLKITKNDSGYIYEHPKIEDIVDIKFSQIVQKLCSPRSVMRGAFRFNIHNSEL